jgi:uncharacterized protein YecT (DUF1311 family)
MRILQTLGALLVCAAAGAVTPTTHGDELSLADHACDGKYSVTSEIVACLITKLTKTDRSLNKIYGLILSELTAGPIGQDAPHFDYWKRDLIKAERAWVTFKEAHCLVAGELLEPGTGVPVETANCLLNLTNERLHFLDDYARLVSHYSNLCHTDRAKCALPDEQP